MGTWFPCRHPDQIRAAQAATATHQARSFVASIVTAMGLCIVIQWIKGIDWTVFVWQAAMGALAFRLSARWTELHRMDVPVLVQRRHAREIEMLAFLAGAGLALAALLWLSPLGSEFSSLSVVVLLMLPVCAIGTSHHLPEAVLAFSMPLLICAFVTAARTFPDSAALVFILMGGYCLGIFALLRSMWRKYVQTADLDVESKRLAQMLREQKEIAENAVQLKTRFLASASHDLRQPMHAISLYLGGLSELDLPPRAREAVNDARECAHDMIDMFRSLLDISQLDARQAVPTFGVFSIADMLSRMEREFTPLAHSRAVQLRVRTGAHYVYSDPAMVERIVQNFVSNAVRHAPDGRVLLASRVIGRGTVRLAVFDNGRGIPEAKQKEIFNEFHRLDPSYRPDSSGGLGLGLAIVRRLADTLRVPVTVRSRLNHGSMFAIDLPRVHVHAPRELLSESEATLEGKLVALIDDESSILQAASFILESAGCTVVTARSHQEILTSLAMSPRVPDAIICDYELGGDQKGTSTIQAIRDEFNRDVPALLITGDTSGGSAMEDKAREMRITLLYKPLEASTLRSSLGSLLHG